MNFNIPFMNYRRLATAGSLVLLILSIGSLSFKGLNLGLDFSGGTLIEVSYEEAAEDTIIATLRSAVEVYAMDQVVQNSNKSYPSNPFDELDKLPDGYTGIGSPNQDGEWVFTEDSHVAHQRNDNTRHKWYYNSSNGEFGDRVAY